MLDNGKIFHVKLLSPWNLEYDLLIVGVTTPQNMANFGTFDIKGQYFDRYNLGMAYYTSVMRDDTQIYLCRLVENRGPVVIKDKVTLYIPAPLVDEAATIELLSSVDIAFTISGVSRYFTGSLSEGEYLTAASAAIRDAARTVDALLGDNLVVDSAITDALYEKPLIDLQSSIRTSLQAEKRDLLRFQAVEEETRVSNLLKKAKELDALKIDTANQQKVLEQRLLQLNTAQSNTDAQRRVLDRIQSIMIALIDNIKTGSLNPQNFPSFQELYDQAAAQLGN